MVKVLHHNIGGAGSIPNRGKIRTLIVYAKKHKYDVICICETHLELGTLKELVANQMKVASSDLDNRVFASHNTDNLQKGGVAIIVMKPGLDAQISQSDTTLGPTWLDDVPLDGNGEQNVIPPDAITGRFLTIHVTVNNQRLYISEIYAPSNNNRARGHFYSFLDTHLPVEDNMILAGDFNNVEDSDVDIIRTRNGAVLGAN